MSDLLIRGLDPETVVRLKEQAQRNGRSMQAEAKLLVETGVRPTIEEWLLRADASRERIRRESGESSVSSADVIREERQRRERHIAGDDT